VILYADRMTDSINAAVGETARRRTVQQEYNAAHGITPKTITKALREMDPSLAAVDADYLDLESARAGGPGGRRKPRKEDDVDPDEIPSLIEKLRDEMKKAAGDMEFERAAELRDRIRGLEQRALL
jgi:excinuclease ABC subunit B